jgi:hypothetical protein
MEVLVRHSFQRSSDNSDVTLIVPLLRQPPFSPPLVDVVTVTTTQRAVGR